MRDTPVVVIAYNRPDKARRLLERLSILKPKNIIFSVDGPRSDRADDAEKVARVQALAETINWTDDVETRFRVENIGLRAAVTDVVTHAVSQYGQAIILEEDTAPGKNWLPYAHTMLNRYRGDERIEHISGYNLAPDRFQSNPGKGSRLSRYPESFAWATWERAWSQFDGTLDWAMDASVDDLIQIVGSRSGALRWKQNFADAEAERISTWAYRWISSMWSRGSYSLSPNQNLVTYTGYDDGTHSVMNEPWSELPLFEGPLEECIQGDVAHDHVADEWIGKQVFAETPYGVARGVAISAALSLRKKYRQSKQHRRQKSARS